MENTASVLKVEPNSEPGMKRGPSSKTRHIVVAAKAKQVDPDTDQVNFVPVRISYRKLELLGHGVFGVVHAAKVAEVHSSLESGPKVVNLLEIGLKGSMSSSLALNCVSCNESDLL